ncbi:MAG: hypothetical protein P8Y27_20665 [Chromatiaceae bacterium]
MLPARTFRSSTFRLALLYMALAVGSVIILLGFIYWATAGYMSRQTDDTIEAEIEGLAEQYRDQGLPGLSSLIAERIARDPGGAAVYLLANRNFTPVVGNLSGWPDAKADGQGWMSFALHDWGPGSNKEHIARARIFDLQGGLHLLVGRDVRELDERGGGAPHRGRQPDQPRDHGRRPVPPGPYRRHGRRFRPAGGQPQPDA